MTNEKLTVIRSEVAPCRMKLDIEVPAETVKKAYDRAVREYHNAAKIPGFRAGKSPKSLLLKRFGIKIQEEARDALLRQALTEAIKQEHLAPESDPRVEDRDQLEVNPDTAFTFSATVEVAPFFDLPDYKNITIEAPASAVDEQAVQRVIDGWLERRTTYEVVNRPAAEGDLLKVNYHGVMKDGSELAETAKMLLDASGTWFPLREPELLPGAKNALIGAEAGSRRTAEVEFPENYFEKAVAGKSAHYEIEVLEVHSAETPEFNDDIARQLGADSADVARESVRQRLQMQENQQRQESIRNRVLKVILDKVQFELPKGALLNETYDVLRSLLEREYQQKRGNVNLEESQSMFMDEAKQLAAERLKRRYVLNRIADAEQIEVTKDELYGTVETLAEHYKMRGDLLVRRLVRSGRINVIAEQLRQEKTTGRLVELAEIKESDQG